MAYTETGGGSGIDKPFDNSFVTRNELYAILDQLKEENKFYELEVFEVSRVSGSRLEQTDDTDETTYQRIDNNLLPGEVVGRYVFSEQGDSIEEIEGRTFLPLNSNIIQYPLQGELWLGMSYKGQQYYLARLSEDIADINFEAFNESTRTSNQTTDFIFRGEGFTNTYPTPARVKTGDTLLQGRFGNTINLSSNDLGAPRITINNRASIVDLSEFNNDGTIFASSDTISINAKKDVFIFSEGDVDIKGNTVNIRNNEAINMVTQQMVTDYVGGVKKDLNIELNRDTRLLPKNSIELAKQMEPFITFIQGEIQAIAYLLLPPTLPGGIPNPAFLQGFKIKFDVLKKLAKKIKEFFDLDFLHKHDFETVSLNAFIEALGLNNLSIDFPVDEWETFFDDIDSAKEKVLQAQADAAQQLLAVQALNTAFTALQQGNGNVESIVAALDAYEADPSNPPIDTTDIRDIISDGTDADGIKNYLDNGGSPQVREAIQGAVQAEQESQQLNQLVKIAELTKSI